jgi:hypothetical protein
VIINTGAIIDPKPVGDLPYLSGRHPCGRCRVGHRVMVGAGASVRDGCSIGDDIIVGVGSVVVSDLLEPGVFLPAKLLRRALQKRPCVKLSAPASAPSMMGAHRASTSFSNTQEKPGSKGLADLSLPMRAAAPTPAPTTAPTAKLMRHPLRHPTASATCATTTTR